MTRVLKPGLNGPDVSRWQTFLRGQGFALDATGVFDAATSVATEKFQRKHDLDVDGKVGNQSYGKALSLGFEMVDFTPESESDTPPLPDFAPLTSAAARQARFGPLAFRASPTAANPERLVITNDWESLNLVRVPVPQLAGMGGAPANGKIAFHRKAAAQLQSLFAAWQGAGLMKRALTFDGAWNPRFIRGKAAEQLLSNHAFGTAFDINYEWNKLGAEPARRGAQGSVFDLVPLANVHGFYWGGHFAKRRDGMHFEFAKNTP